MLNYVEKVISEIFTWFSLIQESNPEKLKLAQFPP